VTKPATVPENHLDVPASRRAASEGLARRRVWQTARMLDEEYRLLRLALTRSGPRSRAMARLLASAGKADARLAETVQASEAVGLRWVPLPTIGDLGLDPPSSRRAWAPRAAEPAWRALSGAEAEVGNAWRRRSLSDLANALRHMSVAHARLAESLEGCAAAASRRDKLRRLGL
jgi:hypothetical protein